MKVLIPSSISLYKSSSKRAAPNLYTKFFTSTSLAGNLKVKYKSTEMYALSFVGQLATYFIINITLILVTYWCIIIDYGFGNHASYSSITAVAPMSTRSHNAGAFATIFFQCGEPSWHIEFEITTTAAVAILHHDDYRLLLSG